MGRWRNRYSYSDSRKLSTADAGEMSLTSTADGAVERANATAENAVLALARLVEVLEAQGLLTTEEVQQVLDLHNYEKVEG